MRLTPVTGKTLCAHTMRSDHPSPPGHIYTGLSTEIIGFPGFNNNIILIIVISAWKKDKKKYNIPI